MKRERKYNQIIVVHLIEQFRQYEQNPPPIPGFSRSRLEYIIHLIVSHKKKKHRGSWAVLYMPYMLNIIPRADKYLEFLKKEGIIEWQNYSAGRNSRLYRLVIEGRTEIYPITDKKIIKRLEDNTKNRTSHNSRKYPYLNRWIYQIEIDKNGALDTIEKEYQRDVKVDKIRAEYRRTYSLGALLKLESGEIYIKVSPTNNRLDSNVTNLPKELLKHVTINGCHLREMDISNSQPFFSACLFSPTPEIEAVITGYLGKSYTMLAKTLQVNDKEDVKRYCELVTSGKFYEYMMGKFKEHNIPFKDRKDVKEQLFIIFFGKNSQTRYNPAVRLFKSEFPNVFKLFAYIKSKNHNRLAILLQRIEAYVILERVAEKITERLPNQPFLTKHDSILPFKLSILTPNTEAIRQIMVETIKEVTGVSPQGRIKRFLPDKILSSISTKQT